MWDRSNCTQAREVVTRGLSSSSLLWSSLRQQAYRSAGSSIEGQVWPGLGTGSVLPLSTGSEASLKRLRAWLTECIGKHSTCESKSIGLPRRVVDIGPASDSLNNVRLYESQGDNAPYICLSYRWSNTANGRLLQANIEQFRTSIRLSALSETFFQAFVVARALGVRYVWIDALCIIQDDDSEKAKDISTMDLIYQSALLKVMSAWSTEQVFSSPSDVYQHQELEIPFEHPGHAEERVFVRRSIPHFFHDDEAKKSLPIMNRA